MEERNYETEAVEQGWNPDFDGPNKVDAQTFVERGEKIAGILKSRLDKQEAKIAQLEESNHKFGEYHKQTLEQQKKKTEATITELQSRLAQAITDGDGQTFTQTQNQINSLQAQQMPTGSDGESQWNTLSHQWAVDNPWYGENQKLATFADGLYDRITSSGFAGPAFFSELTRRVKEAFPEDFKNPNRSNANAVEDGGERGKTNSKKHSYDNLDATAKRACDEFEKQGFMTREDYVKNYEWEE